MITVHNSYSLLPYNTFGIDVKTELFMEYESVGDLLEILSLIYFYSKPYLHIGGGSNLLFLSDFRGTILHSAIKGIEMVEETEDWVKIRVGAGVVWDDLVAYCVEHNWGGAENLSHIPGEVGASAVQNIGAYGVEIKDILEAVETVEIKTKEKHVFTNAECGFAYRKSIFKHELKGQHIVTHVIYKLSKKPVFNLEYGNIRNELEKYDTIDLATIRKAIIHIRETKLPDPKVEGNAGSFFMNPLIAKEKYEELLKEYADMPHYVVDSERVKVPAAWMIDRCGWKGKCVGNAGVHANQALVLVNKGGATGKEVVNLARLIQESVKDKFGVEIVPEVNFIGECV